MELKIFRSNQGDCLLISGVDLNQKNHHMLIDGGLVGSFKDYVSKHLNELIHEKGETIDLVCVTHIDQDHILGVITLMDLIGSWRAYDFHLNNPSINFPKPKLKRPPEIEAIWHNSFSENYDLDTFTSSFEQTLHLASSILANSLNPTLEKIYHRVNSVKQGITLSQLIDPDVLNIPLNPHFNGNQVRVNHFINKNFHQVGPFELVMLAPFKEDLEALEQEWISWEQDNRQELIEFFEKLKVKALELGEHDILKLMLQTNLINDLGDRTEVTLPNLASIMFLLEKDHKTILLTGDGHANEVIKGLRKTRKLDPNDQLYVDVLKIPHHGAEANITSDFCKDIIAEHYVFCGNGSHHNPEITVLEEIFNARRGTPQQKSTHQKVNAPFNFWFSAGEETAGTEIRIKYMKEVESKTNEFENISNSFKAHFMGGADDFLVIDLG